MKYSLNLGLIYDIQTDRLLNHRSLIKIIFNPIFRTFGFQIGSIFIDEKFNRYKLEKCKIIFLDFKNSLFYNINGKYIKGE